MEAYLLDWANLLLRWTHVVVAIAWIGSSFYFVFLDNSLTRPTDPELTARGVDGELWAVHGGGFYHPQKYLVAPRSLPRHLHWFFWESYATWLSGFGLFVVLYLFNAGSFLVEGSVHAWTPGAAVAAALALLVLFWIAYDLICRALDSDALIGAWVLAAVCGAAWLACELFAGRAAFVLVGAMLATAMSANVFFWIIPGQRKVVAQMRAGQAVDPVHGRRAKQRSVHNTYFTLPVLLAMLSNHYGWLVQGRHNAVALVALMLAGALVRHSFVLRHKALVLGRRVPWEFAAGGVALLLGLGLWLAPAPRPDVAGGPPPTLAQVQAVLNLRCLPCHNSQVQQKGVALHTAALIRTHALQVYQQAAVLKLMPLNNATRISDEERELIRRWFEAGASD